MAAAAPASCEGTAPAAEPQLWDIPGLAALRTGTLLPSSEDPSGF